MVCELYISIVLVYELKQLSYTLAVVSYHTIAITNMLLIPPKKIPWMVSSYFIFVL